MKSLNLQSFLTTNLDIDKAEIAAIVNNCMTREVKNGQFLLRANEFCKHSFFVEKGLLRQYSIDEKGKEHILSFAPENWIVSDRASVYFEQASVYYIQALEDTKVVLLNEEFNRMLSKISPRFTDFNNRLLHNHIRHLQHRINLLLGASAEERYVQFVKMYPDILFRVPQAMVASYLGITPESLSRVRRDLAQKDFKK